MVKNFATEDIELIFDELRNKSLIGIQPQALIPVLKFSGR